MANFTGSWARAAGLPMPGAVNPMAQPSENPEGTGAGPMMGSLRPKPNPQAGLGQAKPQAGLGSMMSSIMGSLFGGGKSSGSGTQKLQAMLQKKAAPSRPAAAPAQAAGLSTPDRMDRASKLFAIGAGLMD